MKAVKNGHVLVTGPAVHQQKYGGPAVGLSFAITLASHAAKSKVAATYYVTDHNGNVTGRTEAYADGSVSVFGEQHYAVAA